MRLLKSEGADQWDCSNLKEQANPCENPFGGLALGLQAEGPNVCGAWKFKFILCCFILDTRTDFPFLSSCYHIQHQHQHLCIWEYTIMITIMIIREPYLSAWSCIWEYRRDSLCPACRWCLASLPDDIICEQCTQKSWTLNYYYYYYYWCPASLPDLKDFYFCYFLFHIWNGVQKNSDITIGMLMLIAKWRKLYLDIHDHWPVCNVIYDITYLIDWFPSQAHLSTIAQTSCWALYNHRITFYRALDDGSAAVRSRSVNYS